MNDCDVVCSDDGNEAGFHQAEQELHEIQKVMFSLSVCWIVMCFGTVVEMQSDNMYR